MSRFDKKCFCGKTYLFCSGCDDYKKLPRWMESFCSDNCRKIFNAIMEFRAGVKTVGEAKAVLEECDLSSRDQYDEKMQGFVSAILAGPAVEAEKIDVAEEPEVEPTPETDDVATESSDEVSIEDVSDPVETE